MQRAAQTNTRVLFLGSKRTTIIAHRQTKVITLAMCNVVVVADSTDERADLATNDSDPVAIGDEEIELDPNLFIYFLHKIFLTSIPPENVLDMMLGEGSIVRI